MQSLLGELIESIARMPGEFADIMTSDPLSALLIVVGGLLIAGSVGVMGYLTAGAALDLVVPEPTNPGPRRGEPSRAEHGSEH